MRIAVINETSAADRNADILAALEGRGHEVINAGMRKNFEPQRLRVREILDDTQFAKYEAYEDNMIRQAQMGLKMMSAMAKK